MTLLSLHVPAHAQDRGKADPFQPAQPPAWPSEWSQGYQPKPKAEEPAPAAAPEDPEAGETSARPAPEPKAKPAKKQRKSAVTRRPAPTNVLASSERRNQVFLFDAEGRLLDEQQAAAPAPAPAPATAAPETPPAPAPVEPEPAPKTAQQGPPPDVDLKAAHAWMITGAALIGVGVVAGLATGIGQDDTGLMALSFAGGGLLGITGLTVGVVMRNNRYRESGYEPARALPSGIQLQLAVPLP